MALTAAEHRQVQATKNAQRNAGARSLRASLSIHGNDFYTRQDRPLPATGGQNRMTLLRLPELPFGPAEIAAAVDGFDGFERDAFIAVLLLNVTDLPAGQRAVVDGLLDHPHYLTARTYPQVAARLGLHLGTVHEQLRRLREDDPATYRHVRAVRLHLLRRRHCASLDRTHQRRQAAKRQLRHQRYRMWKAGTALAPWLTTDRNAQRRSVHV